MHVVLHALNTCSLLISIKTRNSCSRGELAQRQFVRTEVNFPIFIWRSLSLKKLYRQVWKDSQATWTLPTFFSISYDDREYEQQELQSSENHNITFLTLRSQNGVES